VDDVPWGRRGLSARIRLHAALRDCEALLTELRARAATAGAQISARLWRVCGAQRADADAKGDVEALVLAGEAATLPATAQEHALVPREPEELLPLTRARADE